MHIVFFYNLDSYKLINLPLRKNPFKGYILLYMHLQLFTLITSIFYFFK